MLRFSLFEANMASASSSNPFLRVVPKLPPIRTIFNVRCWPGHHGGQVQIPDSAIFSSGHGSQGEDVRTLISFKKAASSPQKKQVMNGGNFVCLEYFDYTSSNVWIHIMYEYIHSHWLDRLIRVGSSEAQGRRLLARPHRLQPWYWYSLYIRIHIHVYIYMYTLCACLYARMMCFKVVIMIHIFWNSL